MAKIRDKQPDADAGRKIVDEQLEGLEARLTSMYGNTAKEVQADLDKFLDKYKKADAEKQAMVEAGELTEKEYLDWRERQIFRTNSMKAKIDDLTARVVNADKQAMAMVNDQLPETYATSYNFGGYKAETLSGAAGFDYTQFTIINQDAVRTLATEDPDLIPWKSDVDVPEDEKWNRQHVQEAVFQGITKGDSMDDVAKRLLPVVNIDKNAAIRTARTAVNGIENKGRKDATERVREAGIPMIETWSCTHDNRTRDTHILLDGTTPDDKGMFGKGILSKLMAYPGDPAGDPAEVYNCRCGLVSSIKGIDHSKDNELYAQMMEEEYFEDWVQVKEDRQEKEAAFQSKKEGAAERVAAKRSENENIVSALHITSEANIDSILKNGFDLSKSGSGAGEIWGSGVYFANEETEKLFYSYRLSNQNGIEANIDTSNMLTVDLGSGSVKSPAKMYDIAAKQLPEDQFKEYKALLKEQDATGSEAKRLAFEETVKEHYTGLIIKQDQPEGIDIFSGGNQIVVYDTSVIDVVGKSDINGERIEPEEKPAEEMPPAKETETEYLPEVIYREQPNTEHISFETEDGVITQMNKDEYIEWQAENSTKKIVEENFEEKYGMTIEKARFNFEQTNMNPNDKWESFSDVAEKARDDILQVTQGSYGGRCGYIQSADGSKAINAFLRRGEVDFYKVSEMQKTIDSMNRLIDTTELDKDIVVDRCAGIDALKAMGIDVGETGKSFRIGHAFCTEGLDVEGVVDNINNNYVGSTIIDKGFMSASVSPDNNVFGGSDVTFTTLAPAGTHAYVSDNLVESEVVFAPNTEQEILGARVQERKVRDYEGKETTRKVVEIILKIV